MRLTSLLFDSDTLSRSNLSGLLRAHPDVVIIGEASGIDEAGALIARRQPDVVFTEIRLAHKSVLNLMPSIGPSTDIVFVSDYSDYAVRAYELDALDYILKPVRADRLFATIERLKRCHSCERGCLANRGVLTPCSQVTIKTETGQEVVHIDDICIVLSDGNYTSVYLNGRKTLFVRQTLAHWGELLPEACFLRIHRNCIINTNHIQRVQKDQNGAYSVYLVLYKEPFAISRRRLPLVKNRLQSLLPI